MANSYEQKDYAMPMRADSEAVAKKVAEMCPVTDQMRERSAQNDRAKLRDEFDRLQHLIAWEREAIGQTQGALSEYEGKVTKAKKALDALDSSGIRPSVKRSRKAELASDIAHFGDRIAFWKTQVEKHEKLLAQNEAKLAAFDVEGLKAFEAEQKLLESI